MGQSIKDVMTKKVTTVAHDATIAEAARLMQQDDIGDVLVTEGKTVCGILTDRDIVIRAIAQDRDPRETTVGEICTHDLVTLEPTATIEEAKRLMSDRAVRRLPVCENGKPIGVVSLGDLAVEGDGDRPLTAISSAPPNN
ncbi:MAG TPA: CBS domain-containing protein [Acidimicrobiales bacterium]